MSNIFIIYGYGGYSKENWFPWLSDELEKLGHKAIIPNFPNPGNPKLDEWLNYFEQFKVNEKTIIIGHSLGAAFLLSLLEKHRMKAAFFVASVSGPIKHEIDSRIENVYS